MSFVMFIAMDVKTLLDENMYDLIIFDCFD